MTFANLGLSDELLRAVSESGYDEPTPIQRQAIPSVLMGKDLVGIAQTGTGKTASSEEAQDMHAALRRHIAAKYGKDIADNTSILYGGSCNPKNAQELFAKPDVDGGLIGGASLKSRDFVDIIKSF